METGPRFANARLAGPLAGPCVVSYVIICFLTLSATTSLAADTTDGRFLTGLRERQLFDLAEAYCTRRLARDDLPDDRRAALTIELVRTHAQHALQSPPDARASLWTKAHSVADDFKARRANHPRWLLVELQDALTWLAQGELVRQEAEVVARGRPTRDEARQYLRTAVRRLDALGEQIGAQLSRRRRRARTIAAGELTNLELESLARNVAYQHARALRNQGQCYDADSPDRVNSLAQAVERLVRVASGAVADDLVWQCRIDEVVCYRLLGDRTRATEKLSALVAKKPPPRIALVAEAEKIRLRLAAGRLDEALGEVNKGRTIAGESSPQLDYAHLETFVAAWQSATRAGRGAVATKFLGQATGQVQLIEREHGPYWMRRAKMLLASSITGASAGGSLAALKIAAEEAYLGGQTAEALATYDRAFDAAIGQGDERQAFDLGFAAATIQHDAGHRRQALERYRRLALRVASHPQAGEAHLLAVFNAAELARATSPEERPAALEAYAALLDEHLKQWPQAATAVKARWWLASLRQSEQRWEEAIAAYREIRSGDEQFEAAGRASAVCYAAWLEELSARGEPTHDLARRAADDFERLIGGPGGRGPREWSEQARFTALAAAKLRLRYGRRDFAPAERVLAEALRASGDAPDDWKASARSLLVYALAGQGKWREATAELDRIPSASIEQLVGMLEGLVELVDTAGAQGRRDVAALALRTVKLIESSRQRPSAADARSVARSRARALEAAGRHQEALAAYNSLAESLPGDGHVQEARAALLAAQGDAAGLTEALSAWRDVEKKSRLGGDRWFRARLAQAEVYHRLGQNEKAAKLIKLTRTLHPELGGTSMHAKFLALLAECE